MHYLKLLLLLFFFSILVLVIGDGVSFIDSVRVLSFQAFKGDLFQTVIWDIRLPKMITAIAVGGGLSVAGLILQTFFQNPLVGPYVLGIPSGSSLAVVLWVTFSSSLQVLFPYGQVGISILGAFIMLSVLLFFSQLLNSKFSLLILGLVMSYFIGGIINVIISFSSAEHLKSFFMWTMGSFQRTSFNESIFLLSVVVLAVLVLIFILKHLNALSLGDNNLISLGLSLGHTKIIILLVSSIIVGLSTAYCGPIIFIGMLTPHIVRLSLKKYDHRELLPLCFIVGSILALVSEFLSSSTGVISIPVNGVISLWGVPLLTYFLIKDSSSAVEN